MSQISDKDYRYICDLVYQFSRINLGDNKKELVTSRLGKRLREKGFQSVAEYCRLLESQTPDAKDELVHLVDALSTNHTHFFREAKHFEFMQETALPDFCMRFGVRGEKHFRLWSAASSSGEEPYSLAIMLSEYFADKPGYTWQIEATDISTRILKKAQNAVYPEDRVHEVRKDLLRRYFQKGMGEWEGHFRVKKILRDRIHFFNMNLLQGHYPFQEKFHVVFCRNVMIYFDRETQEQLVSQIHDQLHPGGYLIIGHAESLTGVRHSFRGLKPSVYQKIHAS